MEYPASKEPQVHGTIHREGTQSEYAASIRALPLASTRGSSLASGSSG